MKKVFIFGLMFVGMLSLTGCLRTTNTDTIDFILNGDVFIEMTTEEIYTEPGFIATKGGINLQNYVAVSGEVDEDTPGKYYINYVLNYEETVMNLIRSITVVDAYDANDPDRILYDGSCENVEIHYIDLDAMGDSTLIDCGDYEIVIDAGTTGVGRDLVVPYLQDYVTDGIIELVIATHPDFDHFGGFTGDGVFSAFIVERILDFGYEKDTNIYDDYELDRFLEEAIVCSGSEALAGLEGCQPYYTITEDLVLTVIDTGFYDGLDSNHNENSIVVLLQHGDLSFLFTGDAEFEAEEHMIDSLEHVDVYKAGHHGSKTANSEIFLADITPEDIIISVHFPDDDDGENQYSIPQQEAIDRLFGYTDNIYATGVNGHIVLVSNGETYSITGSENSTLLKDSLWFAEHRVYPTE